MRQEFIFMLPVRPDIMFSNHKNKYKKRIEKRQRKLIRKLPFIKPFLKNDENILLITTGYSLLTTFEQLLTGWIFIFLKRSLFVFTDKRLFHVPTTLNYAYRNSIVQINYSKNQSIYLKWRTLFVSCRFCNHSDKYFWIRKKEIKKIKALLKTIPFDQDGHMAHDRAHLCPRCAGELIKHVYTCKKCGIEFKNKKKARRLSVFLPGGGYFYTRQYILGVLNVLIELSLIGIISWMAYLQWMTWELSRAVNQTALVYLTISVIGFTYIKVASVFHSVHFIEEYIPMAKTIAPLKK